MTLENTDISARYKDVVQLEKSGAGLPSHAGKEAALYDGSGAQILGRTAVRHWLDPDPDAIAGSWEFSTLGDKSQAQLEALGWTFTGCTGTVTSGMLKLVSTGTTIVRAETTVSLAGDFDYVTAIFSKINTPAAAYRCGTYFVVGDAADQGYGVICNVSVGNVLYQSFAGTYSTLGAGSTVETDAGYGSLIRICRYSGALHVLCGNQCSSYGVGINSAIDASYGWAGATSAEADAITKLAIARYPNNATGLTVFVPFIRRYK